MDVEQKHIKGTISADFWKRYTSLQSRIQNAAADKMEAFLEKHGLWNMRKVVDYAFGLATKYGEAAMAAACEMYDLAALEAGMTLPPAEPVETPSRNYVASAVNNAVKQSEAKVPQTVGNIVKRTGADTMLKNAARDGAEWAWIPVGDTCAFCRMLASRGWQRQSKGAAAHHAEHIHNNCDCQYAVRFNGQGGVAGYDPEQYRKEYDNAEGDTWEEKMNAMRRADYAENKDEVNAQKRTAYAARREREAEKNQTQKNSSASKNQTKTVLPESAGQKQSTSTTEKQWSAQGIDKALGQKVNGTTIQWLSTNLTGQMEERRVSADSVLDAIVHPLSIRPVNIDDQGRSSFQVIGEKATFALDPETGVLTAAWPTHSKLAARLKAA